MNSEKNFGKTEYWKRMKNKRNEKAKLISNKIAKILKT